jgi:hypothetical protein
VEVAAAGRGADGALVADIRVLAAAVHIDDVLGDLLL